MLLLEIVAGVITPAEGMLGEMEPSNDGHHCESCVSASTCSRCASEVQGREKEGEFEGSMQVLMYSAGSYSIMPSMLKTDVSLMDWSEGCFRTEADCEYKA
jgi:hypothetical protein